MKPNTFDMDGRSDGEEISDGEEEVIDFEDLPTEPTNQSSHMSSRPGPLHPSLMAALPQLHRHISTPSSKNRLQHFKNVRRTMTEGLLNTNEDMLELASDLQQRIEILEMENEFLKRGIGGPVADGLQNDHGHRQLTFPRPNLLIQPSRQSYAVILLDADAYIFRQEFLADGTNGGRRAADELYVRASEYLCQELNMSPTEPLQIITKAYANHHGLANHLQSVGFSNSQDDFGRFVEAFNQRVPLFDFANVGSGKERADNKIREWLQHYIAQPQCGHIILGCSHDRGYVTFLEKFAADERTRSKITTLDGPISNINFRGMGFNKRISLWTVFARINPRNPVNNSPQKKKGKQVPPPPQPPKSARQQVNQLLNEQRQKGKKKTKSDQSGVSPQQSSQQQSVEPQTASIKLVSFDAEANKTAAGPSGTAKSIQPGNKSSTQKGKHHIDACTSNATTPGADSGGKAPASEEGKISPNNNRVGANNVLRNSIWQDWWEKMAGVSSLGVR